MAEKVNPSGCGGPGIDGGSPLDPTVFLVSLENASSLPTADGVGYLLNSRFLLLLFRIIR